MVFMTLSEVFILYCTVFVDVVILDSGVVVSQSDSTPTFTSPIQNVTAAIGREAILTCTVTSLGQYKVGWMKADDRTILSLHTRVITHNPRISVIHDDNLRTWQLRIRQLKESDRGCYMCQINTSSMKKQLGCLDVQVPPDIDDSETSGDVTATEGDNVTLVCKATGRPAPRILWRREDGNLILFPNSHHTEKVDTYSGEKLPLTRVDRRQMGAYLCIASNDVPPAVSKRIVLSVNFFPVVDTPNTLVGAPLYTDVQLKCAVEAFPKAIHYWIRSRGDVILPGQKYVISEERLGYNVQMKLLIQNITKRDIGTYTCAATNTIGKNNGTIRLYEIAIQTKPPTTTTIRKLQDISTPTTQIPVQTTRTTTIVMGALMEDPIDNEVVSIEPAPLETMLSSKSTTNCITNYLLPVSVMLSFR